MLFAQGSTATPQEGEQRLALLHGRRLDCLALALDLRKHVSTDLYLPKLLDYVPWSTSDVEIQSFNLTGNVPARLDNEEELAQWILTQPLLQRLRIADFLCAESSLAHFTLQELSKQICSLEVAHDFSAALRYFLSATGLWDVAVELRKKQDSHSSLLSRLAPLREPLCMFASAHLGHGKSPVIPAQSPSSGVLAALTSLTMCAVVVLVEKQDTAGDAPSTGAALQEFVAQLRALNVTNALQLSQRQVNDLYSSLCASPVISVTAAHRFPSRSAHFAQLFRFRRHGAVELRPSTHAAQMETITGEIVVVGDSLYIFESNRAVDEEAMMCRSAEPPLGHLRLIVPLCQTADGGARRPLFHCAAIGSRPRSSAERQGLVIRLAPLWPRTQAVAVLCRALPVPSVARDVPRETFVSMLSSASAPSESNPLLAHTSVPTSIQVVGALDLRISQENPDERTASLDLFDSLQDALLGPDQDRPLR